MGNVMNFFNQGWVGAVIGIIGVISGYIFYKISGVGPRLVYQWSSLKVIGKNEKTPGEIEIYFKGIKVPRIIKTQIIVWNSGKKTIEGNSIVKQDPLRFVFSENEEIIGASILKTTKEVTGCEIIQSSKENEKNILFLNFDYFDPQDGVTIEILHTDIKRYPEFLGSIKGMPKGILYWGHKDKKRGISPSLQSKFILKFAKSPITAWVFMIFGIFSIGLASVPIFSKELALTMLKLDNQNSQFLVFWAAGFTGIVYTFSAIRHLWIFRRYPKVLDPNRIENDINEISTGGSFLAE